MLHYDKARCEGTDDPLCNNCRRREQGRAEYQVHVAPDIKDGKCLNYIEED
jgi:hypothetical protein